jgi:hypothetical protein
VNLLSSMRLDAEGKQDPSSQSNTVGGLTPTASASVALDVFETSSHFWSRRIARIVGETYGKAIGDTDDVGPHTSGVQRRPIRTVWERVEEALRERRLPTTKAYVASFLDIKPPSINDWTKPGGFPTMENTVKLASRLGVNSEWLLTEKGPKRPLPQDALAQRLWEYWPDLDDATKGELVGMAREASGRLRRHQEAG